MNPQELRIAIAQDVLERVVDSDELVVETSSYVKKKNRQVCQVCAIGAMTMTALQNRRLNEALEVDEETDVQEFEANTANLEKFVNTTLGRVFEPLQLGMIETAFEVCFSGYWGNFHLGGRYHAYSVNLANNGEDNLNPEELADYLKLRRALRFGDAVDGSPRQRLRAIMQNIIDHEGTFVP